MGRIAIMKCPRCGNTEGIRQTCMGIVPLSDKPVRDDNEALCGKCGYHGEAWEFGAPDIEP